MKEIIIKTGIKEQYEASDLLYTIIDKVNGNKPAKTWEYDEYHKCFLHIPSQFEEVYIKHKIKSDNDGYYHLIFLISGNSSDKQGQVCGHFIGLLVNHFGLDQVFLFFNFPVRKRKK